MACLRCGRDAREGHAFCPACQETAKAYPIPPNTPVQLPDRSLAVRPPRKRALSAEEALPQLKHTVRSLSLAVVALSVVLGITAGLLLHSLFSPEPPETRNMGRNYTAIEDIH